MRAVDLYSQELKRTHGITTPQLLCLLALRDCGAMNVREIAESVNLRSSTVVGILDRLDAKGLVDRSRGHVDRRTVQVTLTDRGNKVASRAPSLLQVSLTTGLNKLKPQERERVAASLEAVVAMIEAEQLEAAPVLESGAISALPDR